MFSQTSIVEYQFRTIQDTGKEFLIFNHDEAFYFDYVEKENLPVAEILGKYNISRGGQKMFRKLDDLNNVTLLKALPKTREQLVIADQKPSIDWKITNEQNKILGFSVFKAIGNFRGREYTAWFTYEIPVALGPWKLDGLPGLILRAEEKYGVASYEATEIIQNSKIKIPDIVYQSFETHKNSSVVSYKDFISKENKYLKEIQDQSLANLPKGVIIDEVSHFRSSMRESRFEWEKDPLKNK